MKKLFVAFLFATVLILGTWQAHAGAIMSSLDPAQSGIGLACLAGLVFLCRRRSLAGQRAFNPPMGARALLPTRMLTVGLAAFAMASHAGAAPANDDFASRQSIPAGTTVSVTGTTVNATQESFEKTNAAGSQPGESLNETKTVWYDWVPQVSGSVHVSFGGNSAGQTYLLVFQGGSVPTLSQLINQGYLPGDPDNPAPADFQVVAGQEYTLSLGNTNYPGDFTLILTVTPAAMFSVSLTAPQPQAVRSTGQKGEFLFTLSAPAATSLTLNYQAAGNAVSGIDYKSLKGTVTVPAGATTAKVKVKPLASGSDVNGKPTKVKLTLVDGTGYTAGSERVAKVKIYDQN